MKKKIVTGLLVLSLVITSSNISRVNVSAEENGGSLLKSIIQQNEQVQENEMPKISNEEQQAIEYYNNIQKVVESNADLEKIYGGAYIDDTSNLVVLLAENDKNVMNKITSVVDENNIEIEYVSNTLEELKNLKQHITDYVQNNMESEIASYICSTGLDEQNNHLIVELDNITEEKIKKFKDNVSDSDMIEFVNGNKNENGKESISLKGGRGIYCCENSSISRGSIGYRVKKYTSSGYVYGFITAGHFAENVGMNIYIDSDASTKIGTVYSSQQSGSVDAAFVRLTNTSNYSLANAVYYNDTTSYIGGVSLNSQIADPVANATVYKSGSTTRLTDGTVSSTSIDYYLGGIVLKDLARASYDSASGDSGGTVYEAFSPYSVPYTTVGIHVIAGGFFVKANNIASALNVTRY